MEIASGASGGPVLDSLGRVFGVNSTGIDGQRISFVSEIQDIFGITLTNVNLPDRVNGAIRVEELVRRNYLVFDDK